MLCEEVRDENQHSLVLDSDAAESGEVRPQVLYERAGYQIVVAPEEPYKTIRLAESELITVLQAQMRHADVRTTLKIYAHVIPQSQRDSMERIARRSIGTNVPNGTRALAKRVGMKEDW